METERIALSQRERDRLRVLQDVEQGHLTQVEAAGRIHLCDRQVRRLLLRLREQGDRAMLHGLRGRPSNRKFAVTFEQKVLARIRQRYADFGPTLAAEHLAQEGLPVSRETLRKWMTQAAFWRPRSQRVKKIHVWRQRRGSFGELVMQDSSPFRWLEDRGPGTHWLRFRGRYLPLMPCPNASRSASPSGLRPPGLADHNPKPLARIKTKYHVAANHPWRKPWKRTFLSGRNPDISTL